VKHVDPNKRRTVSVSVKETVNCPFKIPYGFKDCGVNSKKNVPRILYQCVVGQSGCYVHTCGCSPATMRAIMQITGTLIPDVAGLTSVISFLRDRPQMKNRDLRDYLTQHLPGRSQWDAQAISNFRAMVMKFLLRSKDLPLTPEDVLDLAKATKMKRSIPAYLDFNELIDSPEVLHNFRDLLHKVLQDSGLVPSLEKYLDRVKAVMPGFDYRIQRDQETGNFSGICRHRCLPPVHF